MNIGFIGTGNMGGAILTGYSQSEASKPNNLLAFSRTKDKLEEICCRTGARICESIEELVLKSDIIILGVKPDSFEKILPVIASRFKAGKILVSMAAGISIDYIRKFLGDKAMIIRIMPNTPAVVGMAMTSASRNENVSDRLFAQVLEIMESIGKVEEVPEEQIHGVVGVSGSSPAYTYMYIDALARAGEEEGMNYSQALRFAAEAVKGAAQMVLSLEETPKQLRQRVCSPGGTTIEAVRTLNKNGFEKKLADGVAATIEKSKKIAR